MGDSTFRDQLEDREWRRDKYRKTEGDERRRERDSWSLPRVELWCRDPTCHYNVRLWGDERKMTEHRTSACHPAFQTATLHNPRSNKHHHQQQHFQQQQPTMSSFLVSTEFSPGIPNDQVQTVQIPRGHSGSNSKSGNNGSNTLKNNSSTASSSQGSQRTRSSNVEYPTMFSTRAGRISHFNEMEKFNPPPNYHQQPQHVQATAVNPYCPSCNGVVPLNHFDPIPEMGGLKGDNFWNFNNHLTRDHSFNSIGGFTLNGQIGPPKKKHKVMNFCSSHKIALVVSTFSLLATIGLIITLFFMKKRGMMEH